MDQSDVEYGEIMKELKTEMFSNRCQQERLREHLWRLEMKRDEQEKPGNKSLGAEMCSNDGRQEKLREQLQGLEKRLRVVQATASMEELMQDKGDEVGHGVLVGNCELCMGAKFGRRIKSVL